MRKESFFIERTARFYETFKFLIYFIILILTFQNFVLNFKENLIVFIIEILLFSAVVLRYSTFLYYTLRFHHFRKNVKPLDNAVIRCGAPGTGKSLSSSYESLLKAIYNWKELQYLYWLLMERLENENYVLTEDDLEIKESYEFYKNSPYIPCLHSNISIKYKGRFAHELTMAEIRQEERLPFMAIVLVDEIGAEVSVDASKNGQRPLVISDTFRLCRHFGEFHITGTEQDKNNIYIDIRRVVGENRTYERMKYLFKPRVLTFIYKLLKWWFRKNMSIGQSKKYSKFMRTFKKFLDNTGFIQLKYVITASTENASQKMNKGKIYFSPFLKYQYDSRVFKNCYLAKNKKLMCKGYDSLRLTPAKAKARFLRSELQNNKK